MTKSYTFKRTIFLIKCISIYSTECEIASFQNSAILKIRQTFFIMFIKIIINVNKGKILISNNYDLSFIPITIR